MKYKTTAKALREGANNLRSAGYCELQNLLRYHDPIAYACGIYGWNYDVYEVYGLTICTGYHGMPGKRLEGSAEAEKRVEAIWYGDAGKNMTDIEKREAVEKLLHEFCKANGGH